MNPLKKHAVIFSILLITACSEKPAESPVNLTSTNSTATYTVTTDSWSGKWNGPEGTFLEIGGSKGVYTITIANLDGPKQYTGSHKDNHITFERDGVTETLEQTNGAGTGMKWLADKSNCLRVREGEGWCRD